MAVLIYIIDVYFCCYRALSGANWRTWWLQSLRNLRLQVSTLLSKINLLVFNNSMWLESIALAIVIAIMMLIPSHSFFFSGWWWRQLECGAKAASVFGKDHVKTQQNTVHGWGNSIRWFTNWCCYTKDHPRGLCGSYNCYHCSQNTNRYGLRQSFGHWCRYVSMCYNNIHIMCSFYHYQYFYKRVKKRKYQPLATH